MSNEGVRHVRALRPCQGPHRPTSPRRRCRQGRRWPRLPPALDILALVDHKVNSVARVLPDASISVVISKFTSRSKVQVNLSFAVHRIGVSL